jgi:S1-C subfamily serine protease
VNGLAGAVVHGWVPLNSRAEPKSENLQTNDVIVRLDEKPVKSAADVQAILETITPGAGVLAVVWRRGSYVSVGMRTGVARREDLEANNA